MPILAKWIITIVLLAFFGYTFAAAGSPPWLKAVIAVIILGVWQIKDPNKKKKEITPVQRKRKNKRENIFILTMVALIIIMIILKFTILG